MLYALTIVAEAARGLLLPTLWPYVSSAGGSKAAYGLLVSSYSFGRMLSVVPLGYLSDMLSPASILILASLLQAVGHALYAAVPTIAAMFAGRILVGLGSATTSIARAHVTRAVSSSRRTEALAHLSGVQFVGFAVLPVAGGALAKLPIISLPLGARLDACTYPAWLLAIANLLCIPLIAAHYSPPSPPTPPPSPTTTPPPSSSTGTAGDGLSAILACLAINLVFRGVLAQLETISIPFMTEAYGTSPATASLYMTIIGILGTALYFSFRTLSARAADRALVGAGLAAVAVACAPLATAHVALPAYLVLLAFVWGVAYPVGQTAILALFSKALHGRAVGGFMGVFSASGAVSPLVLSVLTGWLWAHYGRRSVFASIVGLAAAAAAVLYMAWHSLRVPQDELERKIRRSRQKALFV